MHKSLHHYVLGATIAVALTCDHAAASVRTKPIEASALMPAVAHSNGHGQQSWLNWLFGRFFIASLDGGQVVPPTNATTQGLAFCWLNRSRTRLTYWILLDGVVLKQDFNARTAPEDVTQIHFHIASPGSNGPHGLNVFGPPSEDDLDLRVFYSLNLLNGVWDDSDATVANPGMGDTRKLTDHIADLRNGDIYIQVHTNRFPRPGELRGALRRLF